MDAWDLYHSGHVKRREFECGVAVSQRLQHLVSNFTPYIETLAAIRFKAKYFNISIICAHTPTEDKDDAVKENFYEILEMLYERCPQHNVKIVLGDFNAKVGKEGIFDSTVQIR